MSTMAIVTATTALKLALAKHTLQETKVVRHKPSHDSIGEDFDELRSRW